MQGRTTGRWVAGVAGLALALDVPALGQSQAHAAGTVFTGTPIAGGGFWVLALVVAGLALIFGRPRRR